MPARAVPALFDRRTRALVARFDAAGIDALLVTYPPDQRYLTGAVLEDSAVLVAARSVVIVTDSRFDEQAAQQAGWARKVLRDGGLTEAVAALVAQFRSIRTLGVQGEQMPAAAFLDLRRRLSGRRLKSTDSLVPALRVVKDRGEVRRIERAVAAAEAGFKATLRRVRPGLAERDIAAELIHQMQRAGADGVSFEPIVAVGPRASLPHARADATKVKASQPILFDWGARVEGYCSDLTRMHYPGRMPRRIREIHGIVLEAQLAGIEAVGPGVACEEVDRAARDIIKAAGFGERFGHGLGHGIGLDVHESPRLAPRSKAVLEPGMVVTVEPGIYLPGVGGVRIEDDVLVTARGRRVLTHLPKSL